MRQLPRRSGLNQTLYTDHPGTASSILERMRFVSMKRLSDEHETLFWSIYHTVCHVSRFSDSDKNIQHGTTSVLQHCLHVAYYSCLLVERLSLPVCWEDLIRGALLHDYFLYDWHHYHKTSLLPHGFTHPVTAFRNASADFTLTPREKNIILRHMFPLTPVPPTCLEGWLVCLTDKYISTLETCFPNMTPVIMKP